MATFGAQITEIEFLILHGKARAKQQGLVQARSLFNSLSIQKQSIEAAIASKASDSPEIDDLRAGVEELQANLNRLDTFFHMP